MGGHATSLRRRDPRCRRPHANVDQRRERGNSTTLGDIAVDGDANLLVNVFAAGESGVITATSRVS